MITDTHPIAKQLNLGGSSFHSILSQYRKFQISKKKSEFASLTHMLSCGREKRVIWQSGEVSMGRICYQRGCPV